MLELARYKTNIFSYITFLSNHQIDFNYYFREIIFK